MSVSPFRLLYSHAVIVHQIARFGSVYFSVLRLLAPNQKGDPEEAATAPNGKGSKKKGRTGKGKGHRGTIDVPLPL
jgi:hypothetical protein